MGNWHLSVISNWPLFKLNYLHEFNWICIYVDFNIKRFLTVYLPITFLTWKWSWVKLRGGGWGLVRGLCMSYWGDSSLWEAKVKWLSKMHLFYIEWFCFVTFQDNAPPPPPPSDMQLGFGRNSMMPFGNTTPATSGMCWNLFKRIFFQ